MKNKINLPNDQKIFSVDELKSTGLSYYKINKLVENDHLIKLNRKYYENKLYVGEESDFYYISAYVPNGVICLMSAASYYNLTTYRLDSIDVAIHKNDKISTIPDWPTLTIHYFMENRLYTGMQTIIEGKNQFKIYDIEKTVIDIISFREKIGIEETKEILIKYLERKDRELNKLLRYAKQLKCEDVLRMYLEVLL